jgi:hypothetical protein
MRNKSVRFVLEAGKLNRVRSLRNGPLLPEPDYPVAGTIARHKSNDTGPFIAPFQVEENSIYCDFIHMAKPQGTGKTGF